MSRWTIRAYLMLCPEKRRKKNSGNKGLIYWRRHTGSVKNLWSVACQTLTVKEGCSSSDIERKILEYNKEVRFLDEKRVCEFADSRGAILSE